jgi:hypothetical protein
MVRRAIGYRGGIRALQLESTTDYNPQRSHIWALLGENGMAFVRFYGHFAAAYGTIWLIFVSSIFFTRHAETGSFGIYGFPAIALVYAMFRMIADGPPTRF